MTEFVPKSKEDVEDAPRYEVVKTAVLAEEDNPGPYQALHHIKTGTSHIVRVVGTDKYAQVNYVVIGQSRVTKTDARGDFTYEETTVTGSDEMGSLEPAVLYLVPRIIPVEHAMFAIGELPK